MLNPSSRLVFALAWIIAVSTVPANPALPWCPDPAPDAQGFRPCPCPACMAPCAFPAEPQGECRGPDGAVSESTFTCCCCGGSDGYAFRFFTPTLQLYVHSDVSTMSWTDNASSQSFDIVNGDLDTLRASGGDYARSITGCVGDDYSGDSMAVATTPPTGSCIFYLIRNDSGHSYDAHGGSQIGSRDPQIAASGSDCL